MTVVEDEEGTLGAPFGGPLARVVPLLAGGEVGAALMGREESLGVLLEGWTADLME